jgi:hypothetical protein
MVAFFFPEIYPESNIQSGLTQIYFRTYGYGPSSIPGVQFGYILHGIHHPQSWVEALGSH